MGGYEVVKNYSADFSGGPGDRALVAISVGVIPTSAIGYINYIDPEDTFTPVTASTI
jgi:hypothetical protein